MKTNFQVLIKSILILAAWTSAVALAGRDLRELAQGPPIYLRDGRLSKDQYLKVPVARLSRPRLVWVNLQALRDMGFDVPDRLNENTKQILLDSLAWVSVDRNVMPVEITNDRREMYADFYGGTGLGSNTGSARAASAGWIQAKGVGITGHLKFFDSEHTARSTVHESIKDAVWGEILNNELEFGANRLLAIIDRGDILENGEPQFVEYRMDPLRMGHLVPRWFSMDSDDLNRSKKVAEHLEEILPTPLQGFPTNATRGERIVLGMKEYARRIGVQYGRMYMLRLYHGATSESNIEINGRMIDFGTASSQPGYDKIYFLDHVEPFGESQEIRTTLIESLPRTLVTDPDISNLLQKAVHSQTEWKTVLKTEMGEIFQSAFQREREKMALRFTGIPDALVDRLFESHRSLATALVQLTEMDRNRNGSHDIHLKSIDSLGTLSVGRLQPLLESVHQSKSLDPASIRRSASSEQLELLERPLPPSSQTKSNEPGISLAEALSKWFADASALASADGIKAEAFRTLISSRSRFLNRPLEALYLPELRQRTHSITNQYLRERNNTREQKDLIGTTINDIVQGSLRTIQGLKWYEAPVRALRDVGGELKVEIFDARTGANRFELYVPRDRQFQLDKNERADTNAKSISTHPLCERIFSIR